MGLWNGIGNGIGRKKGGINWSSYCTPPSSLTATAVSETQIDLTWADSNTDEDGFRIYISTDAINYTVKGTAIANATTYSATGLTVATLYYFKVVAYKGTAESGASNVVNEVTFSTLNMQSVQPATLSQVVFTYTIYVPGNVWIDWGNGTIQQLSVGINQTKTSDYATNNTTYNITVYGALYCLSLFKISNVTCIVNFAEFSKLVELDELYWYGATTGSTGNFNSLPSTITTLTLNYLGNAVPGNISSLPSGLQNLDLLHCYQTTLTNNAPSGLLYARIRNCWVNLAFGYLPTGLTYLELYTSSISGLISDLPTSLYNFTNTSTDTSTGSLADYPKLLSVLTITNNNLTGNLNDLASTLVTASVKSSAAAVSVSADQIPVWAGTTITFQCALSEAEVNLFLNTWQATCGTGTKTINLAGTAPYNNAPRSAASDAAVTDMQTNHAKTFAFNT